MDPHQKEVQLIFSYQPELPYTDADYLEWMKIQKVNKAIMGQTKQSGGADMAVEIQTAPPPPFFGNPVDDEVVFPSPPSNTGGRAATRRHHPKALATPRVLRPGRTPRRHRRAVANL